jgi:hypothetical protein
MANSDKDILITPNSGSSSADPKIEYVGADSSGNDTITVETLYDGTKSTLSFEGSAGQLFSIVNDLTSDPIFSVNDVSGIPSIEVDSDGEIRLAEFSGNVGIGISSPTELLHVDGTIKANNLTLSSLSAQNSEATAVMIDGSGIIGTRELGSNAFNSTAFLTSSSLSGYATESYVGTQISNLVDSAPGTLDTLNELAAALGDDANFSTTVTNSIATKAPLASPSFTGNITVAGDGFFNGTKLEGDSKEMIRYNDAWLRLNPAGEFTGGIYCAAGILRTDGEFQVGSSGAYFKVTSAGNVTLAGTLDGRDIASDGSKLDGIESGATADQTAAEILTAIKTVDGAGSGLDADLLDGISSASFLRSDATDTFTTLTGTTLTVNGVLSVRDAIDLDDNDILRFGSSDDVEFFCNGSHMYTDLNSGIGNWYIRDGTTTRFTFDDAGDFTATGNVTAYSDERLKDNILVIDGALEKVSQLRGVTFNRTDTEEPRRQTGVIAQEVEKVLPEAVITADDEMQTKSVAYGNMVGLLIEAIKEQQIQIDDLKQQLNEQKEIK